MGLRRDLELKKKPSLEEAVNILRNYTEREIYLKDLANHYVSFRGSYADFSTLLHIGRYMKGLSKRIVSSESKKEIPKQLSLFQ